jgi:hypothetical protein
MAILMLELFRACHNGLFIPGKETPVTGAKRYSNKGSMPTTRIQALVKLPLETPSTSEESSAGNWIRVAPSLLSPENRSCRRLMYSAGFEAIIHQISGPRRIRQS